VAGEDMASKLVASLHKLLDARYRYCVSSPQCFVSNRSLDSPAGGLFRYELSRSSYPGSVGPLLPPSREAFTEPVIFLTTRRLFPRLFRRPLLTPDGSTFFVARYSYTMSIGNTSTGLKVLFIGDPKVGISSFLTVLRGKPFPNLYIPTHADIVDLHAVVPHRSPAEDSKAWENWTSISAQPLATDSDSPSTKSTIQLLDITTYGELYRWSKETAYRGANAVVLCFSVARRESFESLRTKVRIFAFGVMSSRVISALPLVAPAHCAIPPRRSCPSRRNEK